MNEAFSDGRARSTAICCFHPVSRAERLISYSRSPAASSACVLLGNRRDRLAADRLVGLRAAVAGVGASAAVEEVGTRFAGELVVALAAAKAVAAGAAPHDVVAAQSEDAVGGRGADQEVGTARADPVDQLAVAADALIGALVAAPADGAGDAALVGGRTGARCGVAGVDRRAARKQRMGERLAAVVRQ